MTILEGHYSNTFLIVWRYIWFLWDTINHAETEKVNQFIRRTLAIKWRIFLEPSTGSTWEYKTWKLQTLWIVGRTPGEILNDMFWHNVIAPKWSQTNSPTPYSHSWHWKKKHTHTQVSTQTYLWSMLNQKWICKLQLLHKLQEGHYVHFLPKVVKRTSSSQIMRGSIFLSNPLQITLKHQYHK